MRTLVGIAILTLVCACEIGQRATRFPLARTPRGTGAVIRLAASGAYVEGELLEVRDSALLVFAQPSAELKALGRRDELSLVAFANIESATFANSRIFVAGGMTPPAADLTALRLRSRFPQGLAPEHLQQLLAVTGQPAPATPR